ncbi:MAG: CHAT domain-containing protein, partial [Pyrinomonadaceae bacterium]
LPAGAALVEVAVYRPYNPRAKIKKESWGAPRYVAYVLRHGQPPAWVELGEADPIDDSAAAWRAALADPARADARPLARDLDERVMRPVRKLLGDAKHVFLSPDGALNLVPFAALLDEQDRYLVENYAITYLTSGRDLLRIGTPAASRQGPVVLADPRFGAIAAGVAVAVPARGAPPAAETGDNRRSFDLSTARFSRLPGTAGEARALGSLLAGARLLTEAQATEAALKAVNAPSILHIATHGFFLPDQPKTAMPETRGLALSNPPETPSENPLLRSGLALAGANARQSAGGEDGVLTALEATGLNLWGTKLVVLSACETGLGKVENGEGVYGLRRALVLAGSESQVMSLWQVSDAATRDLMVAYYRRLQAGEGRTEALRQVQLEMLKGGGGGGGGGGGQRGLNEALGGKARAEGRGHPFYWASFIQSGDWRGLNHAAATGK